MEKNSSILFGVPDFFPNHFIKAVAKVNQSRRASFFPILLKVPSSTIAMSQVDRESRGDKLTAGCGRIHFVPSNPFP